MCGEYCYSQATPAIVPGSPPRVRGIPQASVQDLRREGITPACAGNTARVCGDYACSGDHPRVCGEYYDWGIASPPIQGSPPRVRGIPALRSSISANCGITPACAGNTAVPHAPVCPPGDHPRVCGEYSKKIPWLTPCHLN